ncbi:MAG TPA: iron ABC transporter permease [Achromobacter sp.]|uniref:ABC transporter permease n=1 Tax=Achromobacter sp. B7 TaxID=2282475 RepID=UPI000E73DBDE|nr:iron ABC transporter permease [Achromobacter sp. B7]AYD63613.1 iron ABC transporter permease [Achromobacter sp. B7]HCQ47637.1 iron ABC transporter permease [Achromobacter sp.]
MKRLVPILRSPWTWLSLAVLAVLLVFLVWPVLNILSASVLARNDEGLSGWQIMLADPRYVRAIGNTLLLGAGVTLLAAAIGVPLAYLTARHRYPGKALVSILPLITLIIPEVIGAQTWLMILGNNGVLTRALRDGLGLDPPSFYGWPGLLTVMTFTYYAYIYIGTLAAIRGFDAQLEEAAQSLGTSPPISRLKVMAPVVLPAVLASALLVFTMVVGNFATSMILGHRVELLSVLTYQASVSETGSDPVMQSTLATTSIALVMLALFLQRWIVSRGRYEITQGRAAPETPIRGPGLAMAGAALAVMTLSMLPLGTLAVGAFTRAHGPVMRWGEWTLAHLERVLINAPGPVLNSVLFAGAATLIAIAFSTLASYLIVKKRNVLTPWLDYLSSIPLALSGTVIGIGLLMTFGHGAFDLSGTASLIVLAYIVRRLPFGVRNASSTLFNLPDSIEEASISLGVPPLASFLKVVLPLMAPAIAAAAVLTWTTTVSELSASVIVYSPGHETLPIQIFRLIDSGLMAQASAYGLVLIAVILAPVLLATRVFNIRLFA